MVATLIFVRWGTPSLQGTLLNNYAHVFELLSRLRQAVDHPYLVIHGSFRGADVQLPSKSASAADICGICTLDILDARDCAVNVCRHTFHRDCIIDYAQAEADGTEAVPADKGKGKAKKGKRKNTKVPCLPSYLPWLSRLLFFGGGWYSVVSADRTSLPDRFETLLLVSD
jgi:hypothetical protein